MFVSFTNLCKLAALKIFAKESMKANLVLSLLLSLSITSIALADESQVGGNGGVKTSTATSRADMESMSIARGHYSRARALILEALREFDLGTRRAKPDAVLNSKEWRASLVKRAEDLDRFLDPQPRISETGVKFKAEGALIHSSDR